MAQLIGIIQEISGVFYAKDANGEMRVLKAGDQLFAGETIIGDSNNSAQSFITFASSEGGNEYTVNANKQLVLDNTLLLEEQEEALILDTTYDNVPVGETTAGAGEEIANAEDIENLEETAAAGTTEVDALEGRFADRTGDEVDITTDLRDATFPAGTETILDEGEDLTVAEELQDAVLTLSATPQLSEDGGIIIYTVTSDIAPLEDMTVTLSNGLTVTIGAGTTSGTASYSVAESDFEDVYIDSDTIPVSITDSTSGGFGSVDYTTNGSASTEIVDTIDDTTLTLDDVIVYEGSGTAVINASLDHATDTPMTVTLSNGATISFAAGATTGTSTPFSIQSDDVHNDGETYTVSVTGTSGGNFENLITTDTADVTVNDTIDTVTATLTTTTEQISESGGIVTYIVTLSGGPGSVNTYNDLVFTLDNGEEVTIYAGNSVGFTTRTYTDEEIITQPNIVNSIASYTGGSEYEKLVTAGSTNVDINYEPTIEGASASQSDAELFTQAFAQGSLNIDYNIDGASLTNPFSVSYDGGLGTLISQTSVGGITTLITISWILTINEANGDYTFTQTSPYTHDANADSDSAIVSVTITDNDGQQASADLVLTIADDVPSIAVTNAIGMVGDGTYIGTMDILSGADIPAVTSIGLNGVTVAGSEVDSFNFNYDSDTNTGDGYFIYDGKTYNFGFELDGDNYTVNLNNPVSVNIDYSEFSGVASPGAPGESYLVTYTDIETNNTLDARVSAIQDGTTLNLLSLDGSSIPVTAVGTEVNASGSGIGVENNLFESNYKKATTESIKFDPVDNASSITLSFTGTGANDFGGGKSDLLYLTIVGTLPNQTQTIMLSSGSGDYVYNETLSQWEEITDTTYTGGALSSYTVDLPDGWDAIDYMNVTAGFEGTSDTSVKVGFGFETSVTTTISEEVIMDYSAQVVDADNDIDSVDFIVVSDAEEDLVNGVITGTSGDDYILGTSGDDVIDTAGGDDYIDGGEGTDTLIVNAGETLDFSSLGDGKVTNIENLDFRGGSETTVTNLTVQSVFDMTDDNNVLHLMGDSTDSVQIDDNQWESLNITIEVNGITYNQYQGSFFDGTVDQTVILNVQDTINEEII